MFKKKGAASRRTPRPYNARVLRTIFVAIVAFLDTIPHASATMIVALFKSNAKIIDLIIRSWARVLVWAAGIDLRIEGAEAVQPNQRYILVANHYSYFDIP